MIKFKGRSGYEKCLEFLFGLERGGIKYDLSNIRRLLSFLKDPQKNFKSIHIAGTNGKGSVSSILNSFLIENNIKTGLYTSPHISDFRERILVNGKFISKKFVVDFTNRILPLIEKIKPSFFEVTTAMAFEYFSREKVQCAVIEAGLGGRLDSTNIIKPFLSIITAIGIDHTDFLGDTIKKITSEKAGIIKRGVPVVIGDLPKESIAVIKKISKHKGSLLLQSADKIKVRIKSRNNNGFDFIIMDSKEDLHFPVPGDYQLKNIRTAISAITIIENKFHLKNDLTILKKTFLHLKDNSNIRGRFEQISVKPAVVTDVSHNLQALKNIRSNLRYFKYKDLVIIFGMMKDKDLKNCVNEISKLNAGKVILTQPAYGRAASSEELFNALKKKGQRFILSDTVKEAKNIALEIAGKKDLILVTGSFYLVSEFLIN